MSIFRSIARVFVPICDEKPEKAKKFIPNSNIEYTREIFDALGNHFAYEKPDGEWTTLRPARKSHSGPIVSNEGDASWEAIKAMQMPVKLPDNIIVTSQGIVEMSWEDYVNGGKK